MDSSPTFQVHAWPCGLRIAGETLKTASSGRSGLSAGPRRARDSSEAAASNITARNPPVRMIHHIEEFGAEFASCKWIESNLGDQSFLVAAGVNLSREPVEGNPQRGRSRGAEAGMISASLGRNRRM